MDVSNLRLAVASRALGMLPTTMSMEAATALATCGTPRVVRERTCAVEAVLAALVVGLIIGWLLQKYHG